MFGPGVDLFYAYVPLQLNFALLNNVFFLPMCTTISNLLKAWLFEGSTDFSFKVLLML